MREEWITNAHVRGDGAPRYPVSRMAPSAAVRGTTYRARQESRRIPSGTARPTGQPNFGMLSVTALIRASLMMPSTRRNSTGMPVRIQAVQSRALDDGAWPSGWVFGARRFCAIKVMFCSVEVDLPFYVLRESM